MIWQSQKDKGQSNAINLGLRQSTGNIVSYINSDDLYFPGAFDRIAKEYIGLDKWDLIFGDGDVIDENGDLQWEWLSRPYNHSVMTSYHFLLHGFSSRVTPTTAGFTNYIMQQATFWRREVMDKIGYFDESFHFAMDAEYWIRAGHSKLRIRHIPFKIGKFRWIKGTKTQSGPTVFWDNYLEIFRRYRGSRHLAIFLAFYYYNLAEHAMLDINRAIEQGKTVFIRWKTLNTDEQEILRTQAEKGIKLACFLVANELHICNRKEEATRPYRPRSSGCRATRSTRATRGSASVSGSLARSGRIRTTRSCRCRRVKATSRAPPRSYTSVRRPMTATSPTNSPAPACSAGSTQRKRWGSSPATTRR